MLKATVCGFHYNHQLISPLAVKTRHRSNQCRVKTCRHVPRSGMNTRRVLFPAAALTPGCWWASWADCPLLDMSPGEVTQWPRGPSGTSPLRNNSALTSGNLPSLQHVWGHVFQTLRMVSCFLSCTVSTRPCSYENIARQREAYPVPSSEQWWKTCHWYCTGWSLVR